MLNVSYQNADSRNIFFIFVAAILPGLKFIRMKKVVFYFECEDEDASSLIDYCLDAPKQVSDSLVVDDFAICFSKDFKFKP